MGARNLKCIRNPIIFRLQKSLLSHAQWAQNFYFQPPARVTKTTYWVALDYLLPIEDTERVCVAVVQCYRSDIVLILWEICRLATFLPLIHFHKHAHDVHKKIVYRAVLKIGALLLHHFAVVLNDSKGTGTHGIAIVAAFSAKWPCEYDNVLLGIALMVDEDCLFVKMHYNVLKLVFLVYDRLLENIVVLTGDNVSTNWAIDW